MAATPQQPAAPPQTDRTAALGGSGRSGNASGNRLASASASLGDLGPVLITLWACLPAVKAKRVKGEMELDFSPSPQSSLEQRLRD